MATAACQSVFSPETFCVSVNLPELRFVAWSLNDPSALRPLAAGTYLPARDADWMRPSLCLRPTSRTWRVTLISPL